MKKYTYKIKYQNASLDKLLKKYISSLPNKK